MRTAPKAAVQLAKSYEKCVLTCYDSDGAHKPTIGFGSTKGLTLADVGHLTITQEAADALFNAEFQGDAVQALYDQIGSKAIDAMTDNQFGAMVDFVFNEGVIGPTLRKLLVARRFDAVPSALSAYVYATQPGGKKKKLLGLVRRRNAEVELWSTDEPGTTEDMMPSSVLREVKTPPAPSPAAATPLATQPQFIASAATAIGTTALAVVPGVQAAQGALEQASRAIEPYAAHDARLAALQAYVLGGVAVLALVATGLMILKRFAARQESAGVPNKVAVPEPVVRLAA